MININIISISFIIAFCWSSTCCEKKNKIFKRIFIGLFPFLSLSFDPPKKADRVTKGWFSRVPKLSDRSPRRVGSVSKWSTKIHKIM